MELPINWKQVELGTIATKMFGGGTPSTKEPELWSGSVPWITSKKLGEKLYLNSGEKNISDQALQSSTTRLVPAKSLIVATRVGVGKVGINDIELAINQDLAALIVDGSANDLGFLAYQIMSEGVQKEFSAHKRGATIQGITRDHLKRISMVIPPFDEQRKIAAVLSLVQRAIEQQEQLIVLTTELRKALMHKLFTEGLRGEQQKETEIGPIPESWEVVPLGSVAKVGNGSTPKRTNLSYWENGSVPWLNSTKIHELFIESADQFVTPLAVKECHLPHVPAGSLLIAITGQGKTLGNSALVRFDTHINQHLAYARFTSEYVHPEYVLWYMQTQYERLRSIAQAGGSTKGALTCGYLKTVPIPVPSPQEQQEVAEVLGLLHAKSENAYSKRNALHALFRTLLHQLMTAQIRVNELRVEDLCLSEECV